MQLSSRILTALAVLILAVAVVAVRAGSPGTVDAATGTIDVLNVGTCFATDSEVFGIGDCDAGDEEDYNVAGRDEVGEVGTVYATYAHDPKTAADNPRAVLKNSNLIKISISDPDRNLQTPVLLPVGNAERNVSPVGDNPATTGVEETDFELPPTNELLKIREDFAGIDIEDDFYMQWRRRDDTAGVEVLLETSGVQTGFRIVKVQDETDPFKPMDVSDDSLVSFYGEIRRDLNDDNDTADPGEVVFTNLKAHLKLDEDVGAGGTGLPGEEDNAVAPWLSIQQSIPADATIGLMYIVYHTSEYETLVGGLDADGYADTDEPASPPKFSNSEDKAGDALLVEVRADGRVGRQNLRLHETSRFSGQYEGYAELTDENGGEDAAGENGWGLEVGPASGSDIAGAATIGVESGPVVIAYKDTDGSTQLLDIEIDTVPPTITIDTPAHESEGQDTSPNFAGSFLDRESGLREDTFYLYVDNTDDGPESGDSGTPALNLRLGDVYGVVRADGNDPVESLDDYGGFDTRATYAVITHDDVFGLDSDANDPNDDLESVTGDNFDDGDTEGSFGDSVRISIGLEDDENYNHTIDFQGVVADVAGNLGFSDSDNDGPRFINDLGEEDPKTDRYNVIGWYARHIFFLDETDPVIFEEQSVTGFYGENDDDEPQTNRSGVLVAFDKAVDADSIGVDTFSVTLDSAGTEQVGIIDITVEGRAIYLLLDSELASDARPYVDIPDGEWVADPAGNRLTGGAQAAFETKDGITPVLTVTLSGGSGTGEGDEGPSSLTNEAITATISADEEINSTPSLVVVCSNIAWDSDSDEENDKGVGDVAGQRSGNLGNSSANFAPGADDDPNLYGASFNCGDEIVEMQQLQSYSRPGLTWEYEWVNLRGDEALPNGKLTIVAFARDRQSFASLDITRDIGDPALSGNTHNWGATNVEFEYDTELEDPMPTPDSDETVTEARPFVLLAYDDASTISIAEFEIDGTVQDISSIGGNRFLYWPEALGLGSHTVSVDAVDAAGNEDPFEYTFTVAERDPFNLKLIAGWNAVSFPANPIDNAIESVFTEGVIDMVAGWDATDPEKPWSIATRMEGDWSTHEEFATLNKIHAQYGYWVHAQGFLTQRVKLIGGINRTDPEITPPDLVSIPTLAGWNFVGVIDQDGDQTEDNFGEKLANGVDDDGNDIMVEAGDYLGNNKRAYTWDAIRSEFQILEDVDYIDIGDGIWVYYGGGIAP